MGNRSASVGNRLGFEQQDTSPQMNSLSYNPIDSQSTGSAENTVIDPRRRRRMQFGPNQDQTATLGSTGLSPTPQSQPYQRPETLDLNNAFDIIRAGIKKRNLNSGMNSIPLNFGRR